MKRPTTHSGMRWELLVVAFALAGCRRASTHLPSNEQPADLSTSGREVRDELPPPSDLLTSYRRGGFLVGGGDVPFIGSIAHLAGPTPESTLVVVAFSLANRSLTFTREGERYRASYDVVLEFRRDDAVVRRELTHEDVRVGSFRETTRDEESVIFQQAVLLAPFPQMMSVSVRDAGSTRIGTAHAAIVVPRFDSLTVAPPIAVLRARSRRNRTARPELVVSPRATSVFARDSIAEFYVEAYGRGSATAAPVQLSVFDDHEHIVLTDTIAWRAESESLRTALIRIPVDRIGFGVLQLAVTDPLDPTRSRATRARTPFLVAFGEGLAVSSYEQMLGYLRFFSTAERLRALRDAAPADRARAWAAFLAATDPQPSTTENEALREYLSRLADANIRFREESSPGWLTDRGMIFTTLGEPDNFMEPGSGDPMQRTRVQVWEYQRYRSRFVFVDQSGFGRWRLTPGSEAEYRALLRRLSR